MYVPIVVEQTHNGERSYDLLSRLMKDRQILVTGEVNSAMATVAVAQLLFLANDNPEKEITMIINSPGGSVTDGLAIHDTMRFITCPVATVVCGQAASMGSFLAMSGTPGRRFILPRSRIMVHRVSGGAVGNVHDAGGQYSEMLRLNSLLTECYAEYCGGTVAEWTERLRHDTFYSAEEALSLGLADRVISSATEM